MKQRDGSLMGVERSNRVSPRKFSEADHIEDRSVPPHVLMSAPAYFPIQTKEMLRATLCAQQH